MNEIESGLGIEITWLRVIPTMTCRVRVVRWMLSTVWNRLCKTHLPSNIFDEGWSHSLESLPGVAQWGLQSCVTPFPLHMHLSVHIIIMNLNISKYIYVWQKTVIPWTYWKHHLCLQAYRTSVAHIKHASVLPHLSPDHHFSSSDPASVMKTQRETANLLTFFLTYLSPFFLTYLLAFFLTYLSDISPDIPPDISFDILSDISFDMLSDISSDILSDISETKHSTHSFTQKPLHKLYIYLTPRSNSNIHDSFVSVKWQFYSCIRLHRTAPPRSSWVQRCKAPVATHTHTHTHTHHMHQTAPPKKQLSPKMPCKWAHSRNYISWRVQTMKSDACHCGSFTSSV